MHIQKMILSVCCCILISSNVLHAQFKTKQEKGYFNITNIFEPQYLQSLDSTNINNGLAYVKSAGYAFNTINGIFLNPSISVGLGVGIQFTKYKHITPQYLNAEDGIVSEGSVSNQSIGLLPIFADFRYYPSNYRNDILFILDAGYAPVIKIGNKDDKANLNGGPLLKLGAGYKLELSEGVSFLPSVNFNAQRLGDNTILGASIGIGLMF